MPITHLLDTCVYSQPIRKHPAPSVVRRWRSLGEARLCVSALCEAEVLQGLEASGAPSMMERYRKILFGRVQIIEFDATMAQTYGEMAGALMRRGQPRPVMDLLIASTAKTLGLILVTLNVKDFDGMEGLRIEDWSV